MPTLLPLRGEHYIHKGKVWRVTYASRGTNEIVLEDIEDGRKYEVDFSVFKYAFKRVWKIGDVAQFLGRSPRSIYRYEKAGQIKEPNRYDAKAGRRLRFYTKEDVLEMHELISEIHQGRPRKDRRTVNNSVPDKVSILRMFKERFGE